MEADPHGVSDRNSELTLLRTRLAAVERQAHMEIEHVTGRLAHLQSLTAALVAMLTPDQAARS